MKNDASSNLVTIEGDLERITYFNEENHYTIAKIKPFNTPNIVTVVGHMAAVRPGEALQVKGKWEAHPRYGQQLKISSYSVLLPATVDGIQKYLQSGIIKGIGPKMAGRIVNHFGTQTFEIIENSPYRLMEVEGLGKKKIDLIHHAWKDHHVVRELMHFLQAVGLKPAWSAKIIQAYGPKAEEVIRHDPYRLPIDIPDISFYTADAVAQKLGKAKRGPERTRAVILHILQEFINDGNTFTPKDQLLEQGKALFQIEKETIEKELQDLVADDEITVETFSNGQPESVYLNFMRRAEFDLANRLKAFLSVNVDASDLDSEHILNKVRQNLAIQLSDDQLNALEKILSHRMVIITGGPGTGKTTLIRSVNAVFKAHGKSVLLAAPTGRAAKRLSEVTGRDAKTIHRLLEYSPQDASFGKNPDNPLDADVVIIDEASMVDLLLMFHLLRAVPMKALLVMVGDVFQLPPVGPGNMLADMLKSEAIPVFYLNKIFRQARESAIILNAHKVRQGDFPALASADDPDTLSEFYFIEQRNPDKITSTIVELCQSAIPKNFSFDPLDDIQVLTPMHKGVVGTINLNQILQRALNPNPETIQSMGVWFKTGDKVMHLKNNYQKEVFNGDIGRIDSVDKKNQMVMVDYDGRIVNYDAMEMNEITLAYAISVHKSQGSEYPAVIVPMMTQHYPMLQRNLLYTAITRGKKLVVLIGSKRALEIALNNDRPQKRLSNLANRLRTADR
jgi:exodeoxyribonuclease V alpha subunit